MLDMCTYFCVVFSDIGVWWWRNSGMSSPWRDVLVRSRVGRGDLRPYWSARMMMCPTASIAPSLTIITASVSYYAWERDAFDDRIRHKDTKTFWKCRLMEPSLSQVSTVYPYRLSNISFYSFYRFWRWNGACWQWRTDNCLFCFALTHPVGQLCNMWPLSVRIVVFLYEDVYDESINMKLKLWSRIFYSS